MYFREIRFQIASYWLKPIQYLIWNAFLFVGEDEPHLQWKAEMEGIDLAEAELRL